MRLNNTKKYGNEGELLCEQYLIKNEYKIIDRNASTKLMLGEIDIIAQKNEFIIFVEVKRRSYNFIQIHEMVNYYKKKRIYQSAILYMQHKKIPLDKFVVRFDICYINNDTINYFENAFTCQF
jgi:putative endonuclease